MEKLNKISDNPVIKFVVLILTLVIALGLDLPDLLSKSKTSMLEVFIYGIRIFALIWVAYIIYGYWVFKQQYEMEKVLTEKRLEALTNEMIRFEFTARRNNENSIPAGGRRRKMKYIFRDRFDNEIGYTEKEESIKFVNEFLINEYKTNGVISRDSLRRLNEKFGLK